MDLNGLHTFSVLFRHVPSARRMSSAALMMRIRSRRKSSTSRSSYAEYRGSLTMPPSTSPETVAALSNGTPCFARFPAFFRGSHSNSDDSSL